MQKTHIPYGSDVPAGRFECLDCGQQLTMQSKASIPPCPNAQRGGHPNRGYRTMSGQGDAAEDPYPGHV